MKIEKKSSSWSAKDTFNIIKGTSLADAVGSTLEISAAVIGEDLSNDTGEIVNTGYIKTTDGTIYNTISKTARQQLDALCDMIDDEGAITVKVCNQKCKNDQRREFVYFEMV